MKTLFEVSPDWKKHWQGMPAFIKRNQEPFREILVRFSNQADVDDFSRRLEQKFSDKAKAIWHPKLIWNRVEDVHTYVDADQKLAQKPTKAK